MTAPQFIGDPDDQRLEPYRNIRERDLVGRQGLFVAEGKSVLAVLVRQKRFVIRSVLILENRLDSVAEILTTLDPSVPVYTVDRATIDTVAGFPMHRGILAIAERPDGCNVPPDRAASQHWRTVVALSAIANHDNMGAIFRNAAAFDADAVLLDQASCDPLYRKSIRVSVGGVLVTPFHIFETTDAMTEWLDGNGFEIAALSPSGSKPLANWMPAARTALLLGAEGPGVPPDILAARQSVAIEMAAGFDSLNVAASAGIALHHLFVSNRKDA